MQSESRLVSRVSEWWKGFLNQLPGINDIRESGRHVLAGFLIAACFMLIVAFMDDGAVFDFAASFQHSGLPDQWPEGKRTDNNMSCESNHVNSEGVMVCDPKEVKDYGYSNAKETNR